jgi:hypothetical protein
MKETQHTEGKETWRDEFLKCICGFAQGILQPIGTAKGGHWQINSDKP